MLTVILSGGISTFCGALARVCVFAPGRARPLLNLRLRLYVGYYVLLYCGTRKHCPGQRSSCVVFDVSLFLILCVPDRFDTATPHSSVLQTACQCICSNLWFQHRGSKLVISYSIWQVTPMMKWRIVSSWSISLSVADWLPYYVFVVLWNSKALPCST